MLVGFDTSTYQVNPDAFDASHQRMTHAPTVGATLRWPVARGLEFELGAQVAQVARQSWLDFQETTAYQPYGTGNVIEVRGDEVRGTIDLPVRLRLATPGRSGWFLDCAAVPSYMTSSFVRVGTPQIVPAAIARRAVPLRPSAQIFEDASNGFDTRDVFRRWDLRAGGGVGRRLVRGARTMDLAVRWEEGLIDLLKPTTTRYRTRVIRVALTLM